MSKDTSVFSNQSLPSKQAEKSKSTSLKKKSTTSSSLLSSKSEQASIDRLAEKNPNLYNLLKADNLLEDGPPIVGTSSAAFEEDDEIIKRYEKKLGIKKGKKKGMIASLEKDGLDCTYLSLSVFLYIYICFFFVFLFISFD